MKVIFLDIDGVLNNRRTRTKTPDGFTGISDSLCKRLRKIIESVFEETGKKPEVVLTSSWKYLKTTEADYIYMLSKLKKAKAIPIGITKEREGNSIKRGQGIIDYLSENHGVRQYVILDDYIFDMQDELMQHLVLTDEADGLTDSDVKMAIDILKGELLPMEQYEDVVKERGYFRKLWTGGGL